MGRQDILDGVDGLLGELFPVHQEKDPLGPASIQEPFEVQAHEVGLARACRKLDQEAALPQFKGMVQCTHGLGLVRPHRAGLPLPDVVLWDFDRSQRFALPPHFHDAFQIAAREEAGDGTRVVVLVVPEVGQIAVGQEDEGCSQGLGVGQRLLLGDVGVDGVLLGFDDGQGASALVIEDVVGPSALGFLSFGPLEDTDELANDAEVALGPRIEDEVAVG